MTEDSFGWRVVQATRRGVRRRTRHPRYWVAGVFRSWFEPERRRERALTTAVSEAAERFSEQERFEFEHQGRLPGWFWSWVEDRAKWWDSEV